MEAWNVKFTLNGGKIETEIVAAKTKEEAETKILDKYKNKEISIKLIYKSNE